MGYSGRVPLDYTNQTQGVAKIALGRYNATSPNRKGAVFFNPGGPGGDGVFLATVAGTMLQGLVRFTLPTSHLEYA